MTIKQIEAVKDAVLNDGEKRPKSPENGACEYFIGGGTETYFDNETQEKCERKKRFCAATSNTSCEGCKCFSRSKVSREEEFTKLYLECAEQVIRDREAFDQLIGIIKEQQRIIDNIALVYSTKEEYRK